VTPSGVTGRGPRRALLRRRATLVARHRSMDSAVRLKRCAGPMGCRGPPVGAARDSKTPVNDPYAARSEKKASLSRQTGIRLRRALRQPRKPKLEGLVPDSNGGPSDQEQQKEPKPKGGSGRQKAETPPPATDSNADQDLEAEGAVGNLRAWRRAVEPSGETERRPGGQGKDIDRTARRYGLESGGTKPRRPLGGTPGRARPASQTRLRTRENLRRV